MFQGLRTNSLFYVLDKGENPNLQIGQVVSVSNPQTKYPTFNNGFTPQPMETVVDVKVKLNDEEVDFKQLPANGQIANDKNLVVSDNKEAMSAEVDTMLRQSKAILESVDYHKKVVDSCEGMLLQLNPQIAKEREQTEKISKLNGKPIRMMSKDDIEDILKKNNIVLENNVGYDAVYIAHMCLADFYGSSITEEKQMAQFIKDYVDDEDQQDGFIFNRFYADTSFNGVGIPWEEIL